MVQSWEVFREMFVRYYGMTSDVDEAVATYHTGFTMLKSETPDAFIVRAQVLRLRMPVESVSDNDFITRIMAMIEVHHPIIMRKIKKKLDKYR